MSNPPRSDDTVCELLGWDSEFFDRRIARVKAQTLTPVTTQAVLEWCAAEDVDCLYFLAEPSDGRTVILAEENGFGLVDVRVTLEHRSGSAGKTDQWPSETLRPCRPDDVRALRSMANSGFRLSRFYYDAHFQRSKVDLLYETWIDKSCHGYADAVLVTDHRAEVTGYVSCHLRGGTEGQIGLLGVRHDWHGRGLGRRLVTGSLQWFAERGVDTVNVVTQGRNRAALRVYQTSGFQVTNLELWYHRWFVKEAACGNQQTRQVSSATRGPLSIQASERGGTADEVTGRIKKGSRRNV